MLDNNSFPNNSASTGSNSNPLDPLNQILDPNEILFIGSDISNYQELINGINPNVQVYKLDTDHQLSDVTSVLSAYSNLSAIHFVTHASDNNVQLGAEIIDSSTLSNYTNDLTAWGNSLSENGDILFYGCNLAANDGLDLIQNISNITGADVAASNDLTGASNLGGDWDFEATTGSIETGVAFSSSTITGYDDSVFATLSGNINQNETYDDDVSLSGNVTLTGDVSINVSGDFTLDSGLTISGDGVGDRDSLTINATNKVTVGGLIGGSGFQNLTINAPQIEVLSTGIISTRFIDQSGTFDWETSASTGDSGSITFTSAKDYLGTAFFTGLIGALATDPVVTVKGKLLSHVLTSDTEKAGNITITGEDKSTRVGGTTVIFGYSDKTVDIDFTGATIKAADFVVTGNAEDFNPFSGAPEWVQKAFIEPATSSSSYAVGNFTIPASVEIRGSVANITVDNTSIDASGKVEIKSSAIVDSSTKAISLTGTNFISRVAAAYGQAKGDSQTLVKGNSSINAGGDVTISSETTTTAKVLAQVYGNLNQRTTDNITSDSSPSQTKANASKKGFSFAMANTTTVSKALVDTNVVINAPGGNVNVKADGTVKSEGKAQTSIFLDGAAGVGIGVNNDNTTIDTTVNGKITAGGTFVGKTINTNNISNNTINLPSHGYTTGDQVIYDNGGGISIGGTSVDNLNAGLTNGETYTVFVVDSNNIKLTKSEALDIDNSNVSNNVIHSLSPLNGFFLDPSVSIDPTTDNITLNNHGFTTGQKLVYGGDNGGTEPDELLAGNEYYVIVTGVNTFQLAYTLDAAASGDQIDFGGSGSGAGQLFNYYQQDQKSVNSASSSTTQVTFDITQSLDDSTDYFQLFDGVTTKAHGFITGQVVIYDDGTGSNPTELTNGNQYYVIAIDSTNFQLASTLDDAAQGNYIDFNSTGSGTDHTFTYYQQTENTQSFDPTSDVDLTDPANTTINIANHGLVNGQIVNYSSGVETEIGGLTNGKGYFAIVVDENTIQLASTYQNATSATPTAITLSSGATGTSHSFTHATDDDTITVTGHNFYNTQIVNYSPSTANSEIGGLSERGYFVIVVDANTIKLADTYQDAEDGTAINLDTSATGSLSSFTYMESPFQFDPSDTSIIDATNNTITLNNHGFTVGQSLLYEVDPSIVRKR